MMVADPTQLGQIEFANDRERVYFAEAVLGEDVRQFLTSSTGKFLHGRAKLEFDRCRDEMFEFDPYTQEGKKRYQKLSADAWAAQHFLQWCAEALQNGENAATQLEMNDGES